MIYSMTAFARQTVNTDWGNLTWELRSVNHRYFELQLRLPELFHEFEPMLRQRLRELVTRGKIECSLKYQPLQTTQISLNQTLLQNLAQATQQIKQIFPTAGAASTLEILSWPGALQMYEPDSQAIHGAVIESFNQVLQSFLQVREQEGKVLRTILDERLQLCHHEVNKIKPRLPTVLETQRQKINTRIKELSQELDQTRLEQEMTLLAQKMDVSEELDRLQIHIDEVKRVLNAGGAVGRRLDFMMQELNREANTTGSKSMDTIITTAAIELKVLIEQMREQVQNIE